MTMCWSLVSCYSGAAMMMFKLLLLFEAWWKQYIWATIWDPLPSWQNHDWHLWTTARYTLCPFVKSHRLINSSLSSLILHLWAVNMAVMTANACCRDSWPGSALSGAFEVKCMFYPDISFPWPLLMLMDFIYFRCCNDDSESQFLTQNPDENTTIWATVWNPLHLQNQHWHIWGSFANEIVLF